MISAEGRPEAQITRITWNTWLKSGVRLFVDDSLKLFNVLVTWQRRARDRHQLRQMGDYMLKDVGLSRAEVEVECAKPFWRA